ncbi:MAG: ATP-binding cassette domain-containing protein [Candidatus Eisenbacteria bacterium]|nr:ATP-binding cassette domain-containing protein [Candidatus Latescibacterota bacterium]MBD3301299.1 ATP-binding cassette domain-containing protein [Candidatus Eisenbacteria bacterium]
MSTGIRMTTRQHLAWLAAYWKPHRRFLVFLLAFTLVSSAVAIAYPLVLGRVVDDVLRAFRETEGRSVSLDGPLLILGLIALGRFVAGFYPAFRAWMNLNLEKGIRERVFDSLLEKDFTFFGRFRTGDLVTRLTDDITEYPRISWFGCSGIFRFVDSFSKFVFCVAAMFLLDARLALLSMLPVPIMLYVFYLARKELGSTYERQQQAVSRTNNLVESAFSGVRIVKAFGSDTGQRRRLSEILSERVGIQLKLAKLVVLVHEMDNVASRIGQAIVLSVGGLAVIQGDLTVGTLISFYFYLDLLIYPMMDLPNLFVTGRQAFVSIDREEEVLRHPVVVHRNHSSPDGREGRIAEIALEDVGFRYRPELPPALRGITFRARRGERIALVGPVASGKSTLLRLLAGLLPTQEGTYRIDGRPFDEWSWEDLRGRIGYVPQESLLFSETIEENVSFGRPSPADWTRHCLEVAQMGTDLAGMEHGLATPLGQRGTLVSGGQKQRIAIARALAGRPEILLLDDCTASLDAHNEDRFWAGLTGSFPEATVFVVSHRLATIRRADTILVLDEGRLVDAGTHEDLAGRSPVYQTFLYSEQKRSELAAG